VEVSVDGEGAKMKEVPQMKSFQIDENSGIPVWIQVRKRLIYAIATHQFPPGEQLPTVRELAVQLGINYNTVNKVYQDLERDGYIVTKRGRGTFVANLDKNHLIYIGSDIELRADELVQAAMDFGMLPDEIIRLVKDRIAVNTQAPVNQTKALGKDTELRHAQ
jgi:GntR family transcriptional regulator